MEDFFSIDLKTFLPPFQYLPPLGVVKVVGNIATNHRKVVGKSVNCPQTNRRGQGECYGQGDFRVSIFYSHYEVFRKHSLVFIRRILNLTSVFRGRPSLLRDHHWHSFRLPIMEIWRILLMVVWYGSRGWEKCRRLYECVYERALDSNRMVGDSSRTPSFRPILLCDYHRHSIRLAAFQDGRPLHYAIRKDL